MDNMVCMYDVHEEIMSGEESFPVISNHLNLSQKTISQIISDFRGLKRNWNCLEKARIVVNHIGGIIAIGSLQVMSKNFKSSYGFLFNPPYEFHAWAEKDHSVIDFSLPGVIEKGLKSSDKYGPFLSGRTPSILIGVPPKWTIYTRHKILFHIPKEFFNC